MRSIHPIRNMRRCPIAFASAGALLMSACTFRATPNPDALASEPPQVKLSEGSAGAPGMAVSTAQLAADSGKAQPTQVDAGAAAAPSSRVSSQQPMAAAVATSHMGASAVMPLDADPDDAGSPKTPPQHSDAGTVSSAKRQQCDTELSSCLIADPLGYDVCLRMNAEHGCPEPETMGATTTTTTPVLDENGNPISQVCQAELAKCIMRLPTPENAAKCTEAARKCK